MYLLVCPPRHPQMRAHRRGGRPSPAMCPDCGEFPLQRPPGSERSALGGQDASVGPGQCPAHGSEWSCVRPVGLAG